jgi:hypothetical protein
MPSTWQGYIILDFVDSHKNRIETRTAGLGVFDAFWAQILILGVNPSENAGIEISL